MSNVEYEKFKEWLGDCNCKEFTAKFETFEKDFDTMENDYTISLTRFVDEMLLDWGIFRNT